MEKLRLDMDRLEVESFDAGSDRDGRGTVDAHEELTCSKNPTCGAASRGEATYQEEAWTRYACCV
ncbi:MAG TPA: hypothetical protein VHG91_20385 [Longimicrobium sp.]|nr:hypothetical protein [Longimicrobium sp.]